MGESDSGKFTSNTWLFSMGLAATFTLLGVTAGSLGKWALLYKREVMMASGVLILIFGIMSIAGKGLPFLKSNTKLKGKGYFLFGSIFALSWSGCIGPVLGVLLIMAANTATFVGGGILLFIYAMGLLTPLLFLSAYIDRLPREGKLWTFMRGKLLTVKFFGKEYFFHTTNLFSGTLFIILGVFFIFNAQYNIIGLAPSGMTEWIFNLEDKIWELFNI